jgi:nucleotidyltransferase substrate binding protein (TIGR01987 family)
LSGKLASLLASLESALARLEDALRQPRNEYLRDSCIQRFEFSFELLWKSLKAYSDDAGLPTFSPKDSLRNAFQLGILADDPAWLKMLEDRNLTSHTYKEATAEAIYARLPQYVPMMREALRELRHRTAKP